MDITKEIESILAQYINKTVEIERIAKDINYVITLVECDGFQVTPPYKAKVKHAVRSIFLKYREHGLNSREIAEEVVKLI